MSTTFSHLGIHYRTVLVTDARAASIAAMLRANHLFQQVEIQRAPTAKPPRCWYVSYEARDLGRRHELRELFQAELDARAESQWPNYTVRATAWAGVFDLRNQVSQAEYRLTLGPRVQCTCPNDVYRTSREPGMRCKHVAIVRIHQDLGMVLAPLTPAVPATRAAPPVPSPQSRTPNASPCCRCIRPVLENTLRRITEMEGWGWGRERPAYRYAHEDVLRYQGYLAEDLRRTGPCPKCGRSDLPGLPAAAPLPAESERELWAPLRNAA